MEEFPLYIIALVCYYSNTPKNPRMTLADEEDYIIMKKTLVSMMTAAAMAIFLTACGNSAAPAETTAAPAETTTAQAAAETQAAEAETVENDAESPEGGTFTVGFDQDFPPMGFLGDDGEYTGFDLELAQEVANRLGLTYQPQPIAWDAKDMELETGNIDCIWNGFTMNGREENYTWSEPYMDNTQIFVVAPDSGITTLADLKDKVVEVQVDSSAQAALADMPELADTFKELVVTPDYNTAFMDLEQGAVDAIAMDVTVAGYMIQERNLDFVILEESISSEVYGIGFQLGNTQLRDKVQGALEEMAADGTLKTISEKWFGTDVTTIGK